MYETARNVTPEESPRAIESSMTELASICGDLESEVRSLSRRIARAIPGGSPFDVIDKQPPVPGVTSTQIAPAHSHLTDQLQARIAQLGHLARTISGMVERIEL